MMMDKGKIRFITISECDFGFYNCVQTKDFENIGDYYESLKQIYNNEIKRAKQDYLKEIIDEYDNATAGCNDISVFEEWLMEEKKKHGVE